MSDAPTMEAVSTAGGSIGEAGGIFMLHPETFAGSIAAGYANPLAGYVAGRGGVLGEATGATVAAVFAIFEPTMTASLWQEGIAVRGAAGAAAVYWEQLAEFARKHLAGADGLGRIADLGERVIAAAPGPRLPLFVGWRAMALADDKSTNSPGSSSARRSPNAITGTGRWSAESTPICANITGATFSTTARPTAPSSNG